MTQAAESHVCIAFADIQGVLQFLQTQETDEEKDRKINSILERGKGCPTCEAELKAHFDM